jgi:hypothetical protein
MTSFGYNVLGFGTNANAAGENIVTDGLILRYDAGNASSYPGSGTTWSNLASSNFDGTLTNGPTFSSDDGGSLVFDGTNDYVTSNDPLDAGDNSLAGGFQCESGVTFSASAWFKPDDAYWYGAVIGKSGGTGSLATFVVWYDHRYSTKYLRTRLAGTQVTINSGDLTGAWNEVVITWDGSTAKAYLNGSSIDDNVSVGTRSKQTSDFKVGATSGGGGDDTQRFFNGNIAEVKVYNDALTAAEVLQNYDALKGRFGL